MRTLAVFLMLCTPISGSTHWQCLNPLPQENTLTDLFLFDSFSLVAVGGFATVMTTFDGGYNWQVEKQVDGTGLNLNAVDFIDRSTGWAVADSGVVIHTDDGGLTWNRQQTRTKNALYDVDFIDRDRGIAVGRYGTILATTDRGKNWTTLASGSSGDFLKICFIAPDHALVLNNENLLLRSADGGETWIPVSLPHTSQVYLDMVFLDRQKGWLVSSDARVFRTRDGGLSWQSFQPFPNDIFYSIHVLDDQTGWIIGFSPGYG
ncbi:hypothetical protein JW992_11955 [candidate division KSB1 bacterium]|nr:hypothetical protein [candidate division KSB1 bacterium]